MNVVAHVLALEGFSHLLEEELWRSLCPWRKNNIADKISVVPHAEVYVELVLQKGIVFFVELRNELFDYGRGSIAELGLGTVNSLLKDRTFQSSLIE